MTVEPDSWDTIDGADMVPKHAQLFVYTIPRVHKKIKAALAHFRTYLAPHISVEVVAVPVTAEAAAILMGRQLTASEAKRLLDKPLGTVQVLCVDGQQVVQKNGRQRAYLADYDVEIAEGSSVGDPIRRMLFDGCAAEVQAILDREANGALLNLRLERTKVVEPIRHIDTEHGPLQLPVLSLTRVNTSVWVPLGRTVVVGGCTVGEEPCIFLATARRVTAK